MADWHKHAMVHFLSGLNAGFLLYEKYSSG